MMSWLHSRLFGPPPNTRAAAGLIAAGLIAAGLLVAGAGCAKKHDTEKEKPAPKVKVPDCPAKYKLLTAAQRAKGYRCRCSPSAMAGAVWGTDIYTIDSSVCAAALHAGAVTNQGGEVELVLASGCERYLGSTRNSIRSGSWGRYQVSFYFEGNGDGKCFAYRQGKRCPARYRDLPPEKQKEAWRCTCGKDQFTGPVWGTRIYTTDSSLCRAALHAGAVSNEGGAVTAQPAAGCARYQGSAAHGVVSQSWGRFRSSFYFPRKGDGTCVSLKQGDPCPARYRDLPPEAHTAPWRCACAPKQLTGPVWGSGVYTTDSSICAAALHAGAIKAKGGEVTVVGAPGCKRYTGTDQNGVKTRGWGSFASSFFFKGKGKGKCP